MKTLVLGLMAAVAMAKGGGEKPTPPSSAYPIDSRLEGPDSARYTAWVLRALSTWPAAEPRVEVGAAEIAMRCLKASAENERYVAFEQSLWVNAPLAEVTKVVGDYPHYLDLSPGFKEIKVLSTDRNKALLYWEKRTPTFLVPNIKYEMTYLADESRKDRVFFRYKLKESKHLRAADGLIVLERVAARNGASERTRFTRFDFIDPTRGVFSSAPTGLIWKNTFEDIFLSNAGIKLKAEHRDWSYSEVVKESEKLLRAHRVSHDPRHCDAPAF